MNYQPRTEDMRILVVTDDPAQVVPIIRKFPNILQSFPFCANGESLLKDIDAFIGKTLLEWVGYYTPHLAGVGVSISISDRHVNYYPSETLQQLVQGKSPVRLFNPSATKLEQLWAEHKSNT